MFWVNKLSQNQQIQEINSSIKEEKNEKGKEMETEIEADLK